jgi:hypothetical protein
MSAPNDRDEAILEHIRRYHLSTNEVLHRKFFSGANDAAVRRVVSRLVRERKLRSLELFDNRKYHVLTPREAEARGEHRCIGRGFNYQGFVNAYAVLCFCHTHGVEIFTAKEFEATFPDLLVRGVRSRNYYLERGEGQNRLGFILVDYGTNPEKIARKVTRIIARGFALETFTQLIQGGRFVVAVLTPTEQKQWLVRTAVEADPPEFVKIRLEVVPELQDILVNRSKLGPGLRGRDSGTAATPPEGPADACPDGQEGT